MEFSINMRNIIFHSLVLNNQWVVDYYWPAYT